jgi:hypothetical protein
MTNAAYEGTSDAKRTALGTLLIERGMLDEDRLEEALQIGEENNERLGEVLVRMAWVSEEDLAKVLADQWHLRYCERSAISFDGEALRRMSREDATRLEALPIQVDHDGVLVVALAEPTESRLMALRTLLGDNIDFVVVAKGAIEAGLRSELLARGSGGQFASFTDDSASRFHAEAHEHDHHEHENEHEHDDEHDHGHEPGVAEAPVELAPVVQLAPPPAHRADEPGPAAASFDELAAALGDAVSSHVASLRGVVEEADRQREHDRHEIERLTAELAARDAELAARDADLRARHAELVERDEAMQSTQQMLRELADRLT